VKTGTWRTQRHNEPVLGMNCSQIELMSDQAFRTSQEVFLIFGANKTGEFFGYAKMAEHIDKEKAQKWSAASKSSSKPQTIKEEECRARGGSEPIRPTYFLSASQNHIALTSPGELSPTHEDFPFPADGRANTDPTRRRPRADSGSRACTLEADHKSLPTGPLPTRSAEHEAERQQAGGSSSRPTEKGSDGVLRKDTALTPAERGELSEVADEEGSPFRIDWVKVGRLPFNQTKHLRNPWNADREVKVSRDGTEVEPGKSWQGRSCLLSGIAMQLMGLWDRYPTV